VLLLQRRAPELLDELQDDLLFDNESSKLACFRRTRDWAAAKTRTAPPPPQKPLDARLAAIAGEDLDAAESAALDLLTFGGFVFLSTELD